MAYQLTDFEGLDISVAMAAATDQALDHHLHKPNGQEDLTFAYWRPSRGAQRYTAVVTGLLLPRPGERELHGNVAFLPQYLDRVIQGLPTGSGIALLHGHLGPGWQGMSMDDVVAEHDRLAGAVAGVTDLPLLGLTRGTDGAWSGRLWPRKGPRSFERLTARTVRVVGRHLALTFQPTDVAAPASDSQVETVSVWGSLAQGDLIRCRVGIVGLGSVGSLVAEALSRVGLRRLTYIDFDLLETRNLDRTHGASPADVQAALLKVQVAARATTTSHTSAGLELRVVPESVLGRVGFEVALDCDVLISCVDRPWPRHLLNAIAYSQLIPVIDGGIIARVKPDGLPLHVDWRIHTVGPEHACMVCLDALRRSDVALDREGKLDDPDYVQGLSEEDKARFSRRNVFPFSMSVAAHEVLQLVGLVTGIERIGGTGPQMYHAYPGEMEVIAANCRADCEYSELTASAVDLSGNLAVAEVGRTRASGAPAG